MYWIFILFFLLLRWINKLWYHQLKIYTFPLQDRIWIHKLYIINLNFIHFPLQDRRRINLLPLWIKILFTSSWVRGWISQSSSQWLLSVATPELYNSLRNKFPLFVYAITHSTFALFDSTYLILLLTYASFAFFGTKNLVLYCINLFHLYIC